MSDFTVEGWKIGKVKPIWVLRFDEWHKDVPIHPRDYQVDGSNESTPNKKSEVLNIDKSDKSENKKEVLDNNDSVNNEDEGSHGFNGGEDNDPENQ
jgi:hypothetical protein